MPYLREQQAREDLDAGNVRPPADGAELNYAICRLVDQFLVAHGVTYAHLAEVDAALSLSQHEFRRRIVAPYEDDKCQENGDVFSWHPGRVQWTGGLEASP